MAPGCVFAASLWKTNLTLPVSAGIDAVRLTTCQSVDLNGTVN